LAFFVHFNILLRFLNIFNYNENDELSDIVIEHSIVLMDGEDNNNKSKPKLTIETKSRTTGNKGLDLEKQWREKSGKCEHPGWDKVYKETDEEPKLDCDAAGDGEEEQGLSNFDKETKPVKHTALEDKGDWAWVCKYCNFIRCKGCTVDYPDESSGTPTPSQMVFPNKVPSESESDTMSKPDTSTSESSSSQTDDNTIQNKVLSKIIDALVDIIFGD
jgi:hypothetical protein